MELHDVASGGPFPEPGGRRRGRGIRCTDMDGRQKYDHKRYSPKKKSPLYLKKLKRRITTNRWQYRKKKIFTSVYSANDLIEKEGFVCGICKKPIDPLINYPDKYSLSIDHIYPLSKGGTDTLENVQLAHLKCNIKKENKERYSAPQGTTRTYHEPDDRITDHVTGDKFSYRQTVGKGDITEIIEARSRKCPMNKSGDGVG